MLFDMLPHNLYLTNCLVFHIYYFCKKIVNYSLLIPKSVKYDFARKRKETILQYLQ